MNEAGRSNKLSNYEKIRENNIKEKNALLKSLNIATAKKECKADVGNKKKVCVTKQKKIRDDDEYMPASHYIRKLKPEERPLGRSILRSKTKTAMTRRSKRTVAEHPSVEVFNCDQGQCDFKCNDKEELVTHQEISHPSNFECGDCRYHTQELGHLRSHVFHNLHTMKVDYEAIAFVKAKKKGSFAVRSYENSLKKWKEKNRGLQANC